MVYSPSAPQPHKVEGGSDIRSHSQQGPGWPVSNEQCLSLSLRWQRGQDTGPAGVLVRASPTLQGLNNVFLPQSPPPTRKGRNCNTAAALGLSLAVEEILSLACSECVDRIYQLMPRSGGPFPPLMDLAAAKNMGGLANCPSTPGATIPTPPCPPR